MSRRSPAVFACGHWRKRDRLEGLSALMRAAIADAAIAYAAQRRLELRNGRYGGEEGRWHAPQTLAALAERGLVEVRAGPLVRENAYRLTRRGREIAAEIERRRQVRERIASGE